MDVEEKISKILKINNFTGGSIKKDEKITFSCQFCM